MQVHYDETRHLTPSRIYDSRTRRCCGGDHHSSRDCVCDEPDEMSVKLHPLIQAHPLVSDQVSTLEVSIILWQLEELLAKGNRGTVVEFGCYVGTTTLFIRRLLDQYHHDGPLHVYDSFAGLPTKTPQDTSAAGEQFRPGELLASKKQLLRHFYKARLTLPIIHKGWFDGLSSDDVPGEIMLAFLDGDYYESIRDSLRLITPKLASHAVIIVDDYANEALPGARRAVDEWSRGRPVKLRVEASLAIIVT